MNVALKLNEHNGRNEIQFNLNNRASLVESNQLGIVWLDKSYVIWSTLILFISLMFTKAMLYNFECIY